MYRWAVASVMTIALCSVWATSASAQFPKFKAPRVAAPKISAPKLSVRKIQAPKISAPKLSVRRIQAPKVSAPRFRSNVSRSGILRPRSPVIDATPFHRWAATHKPFPNATTGRSGKIMGKYPYEIGMRNTTVSDIGIGAAATISGAPPGTGTVVGKAYKKVWGGW